MTICVGEMSLWFEGCCMCKKSGEFVDHLFLHCDNTRALWGYFFTLFGVEWVMLRWLLELLTSWGDLWGFGQAKMIWR
jgi:hypothetical protein